VLGATGIHRPARGRTRAGAAPLETGAERPTQDSVSGGIKVCVPRIPHPEFPAAQDDGLTFGLLVGLRDQAGAIETGCRLMREGLLFEADDARRHYGDQHISWERQVVSDAESGCHRGSVAQGETSSPGSTRARRPLPESSSLTSSLVTRPRPVPNRG
jgi:hypothetical protein